MKKIALIFLLTCLVLCTFSQNPKRDSLHAVIKTNKNQHKVALAWSDLSFNYNWNQPDSMLYAAGQGLALAEKINSDTARFYAYASIASAHYATNKYKQGIEAGLQAYRIAQKNKNERWEADISNTLGFIYNNAEKYEQAIPFFEKSIEYDRKINYKKGLASALNNMANTYLLMKEIKKSLIYRNEAITLRKELNLTGPLGDCYNDLGETYMMLNKTDSALKYFLESFTIKQKVHDVEMSALSGLNVAKALRTKNNCKEALTYLLIAERCSKEINSNQYLFQVYLEMSRCYKAMGKADEAYEFLEKHIQYKDSVINIESRKQLNELTEQFQSEKKTLEIESLKKEKLKDIQLGNERDKRKNTILFFSVFILLAIGIYTVLLFKRFKLTKAQNIIIEAQKHLVEEKQREILDSIHYAKRIQQSLLPTEKYVQSRLRRLQNNK
jgi:tetratricopeptide (TPR) repeat protein